METQPTLIARLNGLVQLTRWQEHVPFVVPLTIMGALLALQSLSDGAGVDLRLVAVTAANLLVVAYAFMINDIEDAPDDALDPKRAARNPITSGTISVRMGYNACRLVAIITLVLYAMGGGLVLIIGGITLLLSHLYSWKPVRLKAYPVTDIVSHSLMLSGLLLLAGYFTYHTEPGITWFVAAGVTLWSVYGQLYNQLRDYDMDVAAGLKNTTIILGPRYTQVAVWMTIVLAVVCLLVAIALGAFPVWLAAAAGVGIVVSAAFRPKADLRGYSDMAKSASVQIRGLIVFNIIMSAWLAAVLLTQLFR